MIIYLIIATIGAFFGMYRGGIFKNRDEVIGRIKPKWLRKAVHFLVNGDNVNATAFAILCGILAGPLAALFGYIIMFRFATPGWGEYIGAAGGWRPTITVPLKPEVHYIDKIIEPIKTFKNDDKKTLISKLFAKINKERLWGVSGLSLRCGEWGFFLGVLFLSFWPMLAGMLSGPVVYVLSKTLPHKFVWKAFEAFLGAAFFVAIYYAGT
jgi:hypothetical protein